MRTFLALLLAAILTAAAVVPALAANRHALVIGIDIYDNFDDLQKARNDAEAMALALEALGFEVLKGLDVDEREFYRLRHEFAGRIESGDEVVFYFAGHGRDVKRHNVLFLSDVSKGRVSMPWEAIHVDRLMWDMYHLRRGAGVAILILDCCRSINDGTPVVGPRGLAQINSPPGTFVLLSAGAHEFPMDRVSNDDPHPNSVFTRSLLPLLEEPGLSLQELARRVQADVRELARSIGRNQFPAYYDYTIGNFYLNAAQPTPSMKPASSAAEADVVSLTDCDRLAGFSGDLRVIAEGVAFEQIDSERAVPACIEAVASHPSEVRLVFALGRAQHAAENYDEAMLLYLSAAAKGHAGASNNIGVLYRDGLGVRQDYENAMRWFLLAANKGDDMANVNLGWLYQYGKGVRQNYERGMRWFRRAADRGNADAMNSIGWLYSDGLGVAQNYSEAVLWFRRGADAGNPEAMNNIGWHYDWGQGVTQDYDEAMRWYRQAADEGNATALFNLGWMYANGRAVQQSYAMAARFLLHAIELQDVEIVEQMTMHYGAWSVGFRQEMQRQLQDRGLYSGAIDGVFDPAVISAIRKLANECRRYRMRPAC